KSIFLATMSHEIRTPLNGVLGMAQALEADRLSRVQRERVAVIRESGEGLLAILNDILDLSKIEAGKLELEELEFNLAEIARGAHSAFTALANKKSLSFDLRIEDGAAGRYFGDPTRIRQILYNLISNALKFTDQGEVRVEVSRVGTELAFAVIDTGLGIPSDRLPELFSKFMQVDSSTARRFGGSGLGLSICGDLARLMGGRIDVESRLGRGSRFVLTLDLPRVGDSAPTVPLDVTSAASPASLSLKVLAAEDNTVNQLVLKTLLHQIGVDPHIVDNGKKVLEAWAQGDWDMILMDIQMPGMDGLAAAKAIRAREMASGRSRTPIIALSANVMTHHVAEYAAAGMDGHLGKPIDLRKLHAVMASVLAAAQDGQAAARRNRV
ncbi:MAG: ATP-binding protein, partial [Phenylobacterium sp.]